MRLQLLGMLMQFYCVFFFNDTATTEIYTLSLPDALPISCADFTSAHLITWPLVTFRMPIPRVSVKIYLKTSIVVDSEWSKPFHNTHAVASTPSFIAVKLHRNGDISRWGDTQMRKFQGVFTWFSMQSMCNNAIGCCATARKK